MKKNKQELIERYIYLEKWLKNNYPSNMTDNELIDYFSSYFTNKHDVMYLIEAYCLPKEEFESEMTKEAKKGFNKNINALWDRLSEKYSISKDKAHERVSQLMDMNKVQKKLVKPKINIHEKVSDVVDKCIENNNKDELDRKIILEEWLEENYDANSERMINYISILFNEEDAKYLTKAYFMPRSEIMAIIKKYDMNNPAICRWTTQQLMKEYETDSNTILTRIEEVVVINHLMGEGLEDNIKSTKKKEKIKNSCIN